MVNLPQQRLILVLTVPYNSEAYELFPSLQWAYLQAPSTNSCKHGKTLLEFCQELAEYVTKTEVGSEITLIMLWQNVSWFTQAQNRTHNILNYPAPSPGTDVIRGSFIFSLAFLVIREFESIQDETSQIIIAEFCCRQSLLFSIIIFR